jgi:hypothetical protein
MMDRVCARVGCETRLLNHRADALWCSEACRLAARRAGQSGQTPDDPQWLRFLRMLRQAGPRGVHTFEMRRAFIGNPSQRKTELEKRGCRIRVSEREKLNGRAQGVRYFLEFEPDGIGSAMSPGPVSRDAGHTPAGSAGPDPSGDRTLSPPAADMGPDENAGALFAAPSRKPRNALIDEAA